MSDPPPRADAIDASLQCVAGTYLPSPFIGETVYSWSARYQRLTGVVKPERTSQILFGRARAGLNQDFPVGLDWFQQCTRGTLGPLQEVISRRTLYGFHAPWVPLDLARKILAVIKSGQGGSPRKMLGLHKFATVPAPLKACPDCIAEQLRLHCVAIWDGLLQWPTTFVCPSHNTPLLTLRPALHLPRMRNFLLPGEVAASDWLPPAAIPQEMLACLREIGHWAETLVGQPNLHLDGALLRHTYLMQAKTRGWLDINGSLRLQALRDAFKKETHPFAELSGLSFLANVEGHNAGFLHMLLRQHAGHRHPAKHIWLQRFLFRDPEIFLSAFRETKQVHQDGGSAALDAMLKDTQRTLAKLVGQEGRSVNAVSKQLGIAPTVAIKHLRKQGIEYERRPHLPTTTLARLEEMLVAGQSRRMIVTELGIRSAYIKDFLVSRPLLRQAWEKCLFGKRVLEYRAHFLQVLEDNPGVPIKRIRRISGNGFEWLYRNDRGWLEESLPGIWRRPPKQ